MFCRSFFVFLSIFSYDHIHIVHLSSIYGFWLPSLVLSNISQMIPHSLLFYNYPRLPIIRSHNNVLVKKKFIIVFYQIKFIFLLIKYLPFNPSIIWDSNVSFDIYVRVCLHVTPFLELIFVHLPKIGQDYWNNSF